MRHTGRSVASALDRAGQTGGVIGPTTLAVLVLLAVARLARLVTEDVIMERPREWLRQRAGGKLRYFVTCPWCVSIWLGAGAAAVAYNWPDSWAVQIAALALASSEVAGVLASIVMRLED
jgi:hypothetical protein